MLTSAFKHFPHINFLVQVLSSSTPVFHYLKDIPLYFWIYNLTKENSQSSVSMCFALWIQPTKNT
jgi:hypothetical protein